MEIATQFKMDLKAGYGMFLSLGYKREGLLHDFRLPNNIVVGARDYTFWGFNSHFNTPRTKKVVVDFGFDAGGFFDGKQFSASVEPEFNLSPSLQLSATYKLDKVNFPDQNQHFTNNIARVKAIYMVNTKLSMSSFIQYNETDNILLTNFRFRYTPRDGNNLYLVLNDLRNADKSGSIVELPAYLNRTILLKYTHTFRL